MDPEDHKAKPKKKEKGLEKLRTEIVRRASVISKAVAPSTKKKDKDKEKEKSGSVSKNDDQAQRKASKSCSKSSTPGVPASLQNKQTSAQAPPASCCARSDSRPTSPVSPISPVSVFVENINPTSLSKKTSTASGPSTKKVSQASSGKSSRPTSPLNAGALPTKSLNVPARNSPQVVAKSKPEESPLKTFLKTRTCYDLVPTSSKLVVFDTQLTVKKAFYALVANGLRAAPLWSQIHQKFVGMLTITDFIMVLRQFYKMEEVKDTSAESETNAATESKTDDSSSAAAAVQEKRKHMPKARMTEIEEHTIQSWRELMNKQYSMFVSIDPECSLYDGLYQLIKHKIHRLPIVDIDTGNPLYILTHKRILKFIKVCMDNANQMSSGSARNLSTQSLTQACNDVDISWNNNELLKKTLADYRIGTYDNNKFKVLKIYENQMIIEALNLFADYRVSALPVIERGTDRLVNVYSKFDVINLAAERSYNDLSVTIKTALGYRKRQGQAEKKLITCTLNDTIGDICEKVVKAEVHRIVVIDHDHKVLGVVSLSDLLVAMVMDNKKP